MLWQHGLWYTICSPHAFTTVSPVRWMQDLTSVRLLNLRLLHLSTQRLRFFYLINYYTKYYELLDTVFLVLKKKPLGQSRGSIGLSCY